MLALFEFLYLQLLSIIFTERIVYTRPCEKRYNETVTRRELHYASATIIFLTIGTFQLAVRYYKQELESFINVIEYLFYNIYKYLKNINLIFKPFKFQCVYLLTISGKFLEVKRTFTNFLSMEERLRNE